MCDKSIKVSYAKTVHKQLIKIIL